MLLLVSHYHILHSCFWELCSVYCIIWSNATPHCAVWMRTNIKDMAWCNLSGWQSLLQSKFCWYIKRKFVCWSIQFGQGFAGYMNEVSTIQQPKMHVYKVDLQQTLVNSHPVLRFCSVLHTALPDVWLKPDSYGFQSVKTSYGRNLGRTPKSYSFLVSNMKLKIWSEVPVFWHFYASKLAWF